MLVFYRSSLSCLYFCSWFQMDLFKQPKDDQLACKSTLGCFEHKMHCIQKYLIFYMLILNPSWKKNVPYVSSSILYWHLNFESEVFCSYKYELYHLPKTTTVLQISYFSVYVSFMFFRYITVDCSHRCSQKQQNWGITMRNQIFASVYLMDHAGVCSSPISFWNWRFTN